MQAIERLNAENRELQTLVAQLRSITHPDMQTTLRVEQAINETLRAENERLQAQLARVEAAYMEGFNDVEEHAYNRGREDGRAEFERKRPSESD